MAREHTTEVEITKTIPGKKISENNSLRSFTKEELNEVTSKINSPYVLSSRAISGNEILRFDIGEVDHNRPYYYDMRPDIVNFNLYNDEEINNLKIIGTIPENPNEVIINKLLADRILYTGVNIRNKDKYGNNTSELYKPGSYEELINREHKIVVGDTYLIITGILDEDMSKYNSLKEIINGELYINPTPLSKEFESTYKNKINNVIVKENFFDTFISSVNYDLVKDYFKTKWYIQDKIVYNFGISYITEEINNIMKDLTKSDITYYDGNTYKKYNELKDNEIVLSVNDIYLYILEEDLPNVSSYIDEVKKEYEYKVKIREKQIEEELKKQEEDDTYIPKNIPEIPIPDYQKLIKVYWENDIKSKNIIGTRNNHRNN